MSKTKNVKLTYYKAIIVPSGSAVKLKYNLETLFMEFLKEKHKVRDRFRSISTLDNVFHLIPEYNYHQGYIFAPLAELSDIPSPSINRESFSSDSINLKELYEEFEEEHKDKPKSSIIKDYCFFLIKGNKIITQKIRPINLKDFERYFNWALEDKLEEGQKIILEAPTKTDICNIDSVKEITLGDNYFSSLAPSSSVTSEKNVALKKRSLVKSILDICKDSGSLEDYIPEELVTVTVNLKVNNRAWQKHSTEDKVKKALEVDLRNIPDEVKIKLSNGVEYNAHELRWNKSARIRFTDNGYPDEESMKQEMISWLGVINRNV